MAGGDSAVFGVSRSSFVTSRNILKSHRHLQASFASQNPAADLMKP
jgi:hypothetical protein